MDIILAIIAVGLFGFWLLERRYRKQLQGLIADAIKVIDSEHELTDETRKWCKDVTDNAQGLINTIRELDEEKKKLLASVKANQPQDEGHNV